jgi:hypothetical protein
MPTTYVPAKLLTRGQQRSDVAAVALGAIRCAPSFMCREFYARFSQYRSLRSPRASVGVGAQHCCAQSPHDRSDSPQSVLSYSRLAPYISSASSAYTPRHPVAAIVSQIAGFWYRSPQLTPTKKIARSHFQISTAILFHESLVTSHQSLPPPKTMKRRTAFSFRAALQGLFLYLRQLFVFPVPGVPLLSALPLGRAGFGLNNPSPSRIEKLHPHRIAVAM